MTLRSAARAALFALCLVVPEAASRADEPPAPDVQQAIARFKRGQELYAEQNYSAALIEFRKAYELAPNYKVQYNIGQVCYQTQDYVCALQSFQTYLSAGASEIPEQRRKAVQRELDGLKQRVGFLQLQTEVEGAQVTVDDVLIGTTPLKGPLPLSVGRRRISVTKTGSIPFSRTVDIAGQDTARVQVELTPIATTPPPTAPTVAPTVQAPPPAAPVQPPKSQMTTLSWVGFGVGGAMLIGGTVTGVLALGAASDVRDKVYPNQSQANSDKTKTTTLAGVTDGLLIGGIAAIAATTLLTFAVSSDSGENIQVGVSPTGVSTRFAF
jgi:hypothetical protein